jgi:hypothetical protein
MNRKLRSLICSASAGALLLTGAAIVGGGVLSPTHALASASNGIRVPNKMCFWEDVAWDQMNAAEHQAWIELGWSEPMWDSDGDQEPPTSTEDWSDLTGSERAAAYSLGYTQSTWNDLICR